MVVEDEGYVAYVPTPAATPRGTPYRSSWNVRRPWSPKHVSKSLEERHPVDWKTFAELRNLLAHEYFRTSPEDVWKTATEDIPVLKRQVERILAELG